MVAIIVALPQLLYMREQVSQNYFKFWPGWIGEPHQALADLGTPQFKVEWISQLAAAIKVFLKFLVWNAGMLLLLLPLALWKATRNQWLFYLPFIFIFILGNLVKIQPWEWDNNNLFLYWQIGTTIIVASLFNPSPLIPLPLLRGEGKKYLKGTPSLLTQPGDTASSNLFEGNNKLKGTPSLLTQTIKSLQNMQLGKLARIALSTVAISLLIIGGVINIIRTGQERNFLWGASEIKIGTWVRDNTPPGSVFLTGSAHSHPIPSLGGRQVVMGFEGWLFSHGLSYDKVQEDEIKMFQGDMSLIVKYGINYIALTPYERGFALSRSFTLNESFFRNSELFELAYSEQGWDIYRVVGARRAVPSR